MIDIRLYLKNTKNVIVISSQPYDADSICSGILMTQYLKKLGKNVTHIFPRELKPNEVGKFDWLPFIETIVFHDTRDLINNATKDDALIIVDGRDKIQFFDYLNINLPEPDFNKVQKIIRVHHHTIPKNDVAYKIIGSLEYSSTTEVILRNIFPKKVMTSDLALCGYAGLVDDTGNFMWNFTSQTLAMASWLATFGIDCRGTSERVMRQRDVNFYSSLRTVVDKMEIDTELRTVFFELSKSDIERLKLTEDMINSVTFAFLNEVASRLEGVDRGLLLIDRGDHVKVAGRGRGVNKISLPELLLPVGGQGKGHFNAVNFTTDQPFENMKERIKKVIRKNI